MKTQESLHDLNPFVAAFASTLPCYPTWCLSNQGNQRNNNNRQSKARIKENENSRQRIHKKGRKGPVVVSDVVGRGLKCPLCRRLPHHREVRRRHFVRHHFSAENNVDRMSLGCDVARLKIKCDVSLEIQSVVRLHSTQWGSGALHTTPLLFWFWVKDIDFVFAVFFLLLTFTSSVVLSLCGFFPAMW